MKFKNIDKCNISGSKELKLILSLGLIPPVNQMFKINQKPREQVFFPTELYYCPLSKLVQLGISVDKKILFPKDYPYTSSTTKILRDNFKDLANETLKKFNIKNSDLIIDIGSNDGNLLINFKDEMRVLGITPENIGKIAIKKGIPTILDYFSNSLSKKIIKKYGKAKIITATNVFAHIDDINETLKSIKNLLTDDGIFISESHYLLTLIKENQYDTIYHEHLRYYSLSALKFLFNKHGLEIIDAKKINTHGGSIRVYATRKNKHKVNNKHYDLYKEEDKYLHNGGIYKFRDKVIESKLNFYNLLSNINLNKHKVYGISAPSRATTLVNYLGLNSDTLKCILEINGSKKIGHYLPGTNIPIYDESKLYIDQPKYVLILSWHISKEIMYNLRKNGYKGKFIIPLPKPKILN